MGMSRQDELDASDHITELEAEMLQAAEDLEFVRAAQLRDRISNLKKEPEYGMRTTSGTDAPGMPGSKQGRTGRSKKKRSRR